MWERGQDHDGLLVDTQIEEGRASLDAYESSIIPDEDVAVENCHLCDKTVWPDDPTSMVDDREVHRVCGLDARLTALELKHSELSYRVAV